MHSERNIPRHVAIIMDGNGRWAQAQGKERIYGHMQGVESVRSALKAAVRNGVRYLTLYAFSTENWGRPAEEVNALMELLCDSVIRESPELQKQGVRVRIIGERSRMSEKVQAHLARIEKETSTGEQLTLLLAINYSSRSELTATMRRIAAEAKAGTIVPEDIGEQTIAQHLYTADIPDPDLIVRTSGECRLSNFLLWQAAYSEFYFTEVLWPDFNEEEFDRAIQAYQRRDRRFGKLSDQ